MAGNLNSADETFGINEYIGAVPARKKPKSIPGLYPLAFKSAGVAALVFAATTLLLPFVYLTGLEIGQGRFAGGLQTFTSLIAFLVLLFLFGLFTIWPNMKFLRELHRKFTVALPAPQEIWSYSWRHGLKVYWYAQLTLLLPTLIFPLATLFVMIGMIVLSPFTIATAVLTGRYAVRRLIQLVENEKETAYDG